MQSIIDYIKLTYYMHIVYVVCNTYDNCFRRLIKSFQPKEKNEKKQEEAE